ncbi:MAG: acetate/propionate family kinase [Acidobacteriota bacterium]|nr:acetate/propionate family kinase [Acidobacteriota bacterium]
MHILVINSGSSSIKFSIFEAIEGDPNSLFEGEIGGIGNKPGLKFYDAAGHDFSAGLDAAKAETVAGAIGLIVEAVGRPGLPHIDAVGYRVVHPGARLHRHQLITEAVMKQLEKAVEFAPLHDPAAIEVIRDVMSRYPDVEHYACFDTVFHQTMPEVATTYPIPPNFRDQGVRRYGFHGLSCESIVQQLKTESLAAFPRRMIIAHLGSGCSVTAVMDGCSVDTTMGLTPTGGVVMGTRPGDLDPGLVLYLLRHMDGEQVAALEKMLNHEAGMVALSGMPNDMKAVREAAAKGNARAQLAVQIFARSVKKAVGAFAAVLGQVDAVVFAGGIGEHDPQSRAEILGGLEAFGVVLDSGLNHSKASAARLVSVSHSATAVFVVPAKEDWMIARHVERMSLASTRNTSSDQ